MALDAAGLEAKFKKIAGAYEIKGGSDVYFGLSDVKRELGIVQADKAYVTRLLALTDPGAYYTARKAAFDTMSDEVELAYQKSFADYAGSVKAINRVAYCLSPNTELSLDVTECEIYVRTAFNFIVSGEVLNFASSPALSSAIVL